MRAIAMGADAARDAARYSDGRLVDDIAALYEELRSRRGGRRSEARPSSRVDGSTPPD